MIRSVILSSQSSPNQRCHQIAPHGFRKHDGAYLRTLAMHRDLAGLVTLLHIAPGKVDKFGYPQASGIEQASQDGVAWVILQGDHALDRGFTQDAFSQTIAAARDLYWSTNVEGDIPQPVRERDEGLHRCQCTPL